MTEFVQVEQRGPAALITLNRPEKRNALTLSMLAEVSAAVAEARLRAGVRAVLVQGSGRGFSAGIDLAAFTGADRDFGADWRQRMPDITRALQTSLNQVAACPAPTIALLHGFALGLGLELALACDLRLAAAGTQLGLPEARLGLIPDVGGTTRLTRLLGPGRAKQMIFTGGLLEAGTAAAWWLVNEVAAEADLLARGLALADEIALCAPLAVTAAKRVIDQVDDSLTRGLELEAHAQNELVQTADFEAAVQALATKTAPRWLGR
jgi:enoyl-CoA hydratase/carnithine racemase